MRDDQFIAQLLTSLHGNINDSLDNSSVDNTIIQYFTSPRDRCVTSSTVYGTIGGSALSFSNAETVTANTSSKSYVANPSTFTWNGSSAGWVWGYGGVWS